MRGVYIKKAFVIAEDERRKIISVLNGQIGVRDIHILEMKKGEQILGNHYHWYPEIMYILEGGGTWYLRNRMTDEYEKVRLEKGDIMIKTPFITHTAKVDKDSIILDGSAESWVDEDFNHLREELK